LHGDDNYDGGPSAAPGILACPARDLRIRVELQQNPADVHRAGQLGGVDLA